MTELADERLAELRTIAEAATPGPWEWDGLGDFYGTPRMQGWLAAPPWAQEEQTVLRSVAMHADCDIEASDEDAHFIAAFDPPTVLALLAELTEARKWLRGGIEARRSIKTERDELQRRLDAVLKLHRKHDCTTHWQSCQIVHGGYCNRKRQCTECHYPYPCLTVKAARGDA